VCGVAAAPIGFKQRSLRPQVDAGPKILGRDATGAGRSGGRSGDAIQAGQCGFLHPLQRAAGV